MFHADLGAALKKAGFPRVGGRGGGAEDWTRHFTENAGSREEAMEILRRVTRDFDKRNGTWISRYLDDALESGQPPAPIPRK